MASGSSSSPGTRWARDPDLAGVAGEHVLAVVVDEPDLDAEEHRPTEPSRTGMPVELVTTGDASVSP